MIRVSGKTRCSTLAPAGPALLRLRRPLPPLDSGYSLGLGSLSDGPSRREAGAGAGCRGRRSSFPRSLCQRWRRPGTGLDRGASASGSGLSGAGSPRCPACRGQQVGARCPEKVCAGGRRRVSRPPALPRTALRPTPQPIRARGPHHGEVPGRSVCGTRHGHQALPPGMGCAGSGRGRGREEQGHLRTGLWGSRAG
jgi:hypothetical protein